MNNEVKLIDYYEEDGREVEIYKYKGVIIYFNLYYEYEYTIDGYWYTSLDKAKEAIDIKLKNRR